MLEGVICRQTVREEMICRRNVLEDVNCRQNVLGRGASSRPEGDLGDLEAWKRFGGLGRGGGLWSGFVRGD